MLGDTPTIKTESPLKNIKKAIAEKNILNVIDILYRPTEIFFCQHTIQD